MCVNLSSRLFNVNIFKCWHRENSIRVAHIWLWQQVIDCVFLWGLELLRNVQDCFIYSGKATLPKSIHLYLLLLKLRETVIMYKMRQKLLLIIF